MSQENSPGYAQGQADAAADDTAISRCPPGVPAGPRYPPGYPNNMYARGYEDNFVGVPHICTAACRKDD